MANIPCHSGKPDFMKSILIIMLFISFQSQRCTKDYTDFACINRKIADIKAKVKRNPPAEVNEYLYRGKHVFLFSADCCDQYYELYDENCNYICAPSGGFGGHGDGKCSDFSSSAQHIRLVWKDSR
jgi:hypothetical protein